MAESWIRRIFTRSPSRDVAERERIEVLEAKLDRSEATLREVFAIAGIPWGGGVDGGADVFAAGPFLGGPYSEDGLPVVPFATGTITDRRWGKNLPLIWSEQDLRHYRKLVRWFADTNPFAIGFKTLLTAFHIRQGCGWKAHLVGMSPGSFAAPVDADGDGVPDVHPDVARAQTILDRWRMLARWPLKSQEAFRRWSVDGETFIRFFARQLAGGLPAFRFLLPEQIVAPAGASEGPWSFGKYTDPRDAERVLAYNVLWRNGDTLQAEEVDACHVVEILKNVDSDVKRGLSDYAPIGAYFDRVGRLITNTAETAIAQAAIAWWEKYGTATGTQVSTMIEQGRDYSTLKATPSGIKTESATKYSPGTVVRSEGTRDVAPGPASTPGGFIEVEGMLLRAIGTRWNCPEYFSGDASNNNYASLLAAGGPFVSTVESQQVLWCDFERRIARKVLELTEPHLLDRIDILVTPQSVALVNKLEDEQIKALKKQNGVLSATEWILQDGRNPKQTFAELAAEQQQQPQEQSQGGMFEGLAPGDVIVTRREYRLLSEDERAGLIKKVVTDKNGNRTTRWVRSAAAAVGRGAKRTHSAVKGALAATQAALEKTRGGRHLLRYGRGTVKVAAAIEHRLSIVQHKIHEVAQEAARGRGMSESGVKTLGRCLYAADLLGGWAAGYTAHAVGLPLVAVKSSAVLPTLSVAYLMYSTARDPVGTWKAAKTVIGHTFARRKPAHEAVEDFDLPSELAQRLSEVKDHDWAEALWYAALDHTQGDVKAALELFDEAMAASPAQESKLAESFTGTITDSAGRKRHYVNGKPVASHPEGGHHLDGGEQRPVSHFTSLFDRAGEIRGDQMTVKGRDLDQAAADLRHSSPEELRQIAAHIGVKGKTVQDLANKIHTAIASRNNESWRAAEGMVKLSKDDLAKGDVPFPQAAKPTPSPAPAPLPSPKPKPGKTEEPPQSEIGKTIHGYIDWSTVSDADFERMKAEIRKLPPDELRRIAKRKATADDVIAALADRKGIADRNEY